MYTAGKAVKAYAIYQEKGASYANIPSSRRVMIKEKKLNPHHVQISHFINQRNTIFKWNLGGEICKISKLTIY